MLNGFKWTIYLMSDGLPVKDLVMARLCFYSTASVYLEVVSLSAEENLEKTASNITPGMEKDFEPVGFEDDRLGKLLNHSFSLPAEGLESLRWLLVKVYIDPEMGNEIFVQISSGGIMRQMLLKTFIEQASVV